MPNDQLIQYPSLSQFFLANGAMNKKPRILLPFHNHICSALEQLVTGRLPKGKKNLMLLMPPRHGKTFLIRDFISWSIGIFPDSEYIYASYSDDLATASTTAVKMTLEQDWYNYIFPDMMLTKWRGDFFTTEQGGCVYGTTVEGTVTGFGAGKKRPLFGGAFIIDDAMNAKHARSKTVKEGLRQQYSGVFKSRLNNDNTPFVLIAQRLAPDDLPGYILETEGDQWHVLKFPGLQADGTALWPQVRSVDSYNRLKRIDPFTFYAQEQQEPQIEGGNIVKKDWWKFYDSVNQDYIVNGLLFLTADTAMKTKTMNDFTSIQAWHCQQENGLMYLDLLDEVRGKFEFPALLREAKAFWNKWIKFGASRFYVEDKVSGTSLQQMLKQQGMPALAWKPGEHEFPEDKVGRVKMTTWYIEAGRIRLPVHNEDLCNHIMDECAAFSGSDTDVDDSVDALTMACSIWKSKGGGFDVQTQ